jgi:ribose transport system permease protein
MLLKVGEIKMENLNTIKVERILSKNATVFLFIFAIVVASIVSPNFATSFNITNLLRQTSFIAMVTIGMSLTLLIGGIDLSVGSVFAIGSVFTASMAQTGNLFLIILAPLLLGGLIGLFNGVLITKAKIQPFIVTLCMMLAGRGIALSYAHELPISISSDFAQLKFLGRGKIGFVPVPFIIVIIAFLAIWYLLSNTAFGRKIYAVGGNEEATKLMGVNVNRVKVVIYSLSGLFAAFAGLLLATRLGSGNPTDGNGYEMDAIAAAVVGGILMSGGKGRIIDALFGALIIGIISNVLNLVGIGSWYQKIIKGIIIIIAVLSQSIVEKNNK